MLPEYFSNSLPDKRLSPHDNSPWWKGGDLSKEFNKLGINHPDDMYGIIIESYIARLRGEEFSLEEMVVRYQLYWQRIKPPESIINEKTGHKIGIVESQVVYNLDDGRIIHVGEDKTNKRKWFFELERGWYLPDEQELAKLSSKVKGTSKLLEKGDGK